MKFIAILVGKLIIIAGNILHRGSSLPGKVALKIDKYLLKRFKYPKIRIAVTGSSGKGSTTYLIANFLKEKGYDVCYNEEGSNLAWGITTCFLRKSNLLGKIKSAYLVIEVDERYAKNIFKYLKPTHVVITNLTKDQPPRQHHVDNVYNDVLKSITPNTKIITNLDDPYLRNFKKDLDNENIYYSIAKNKYSYENQIFENLNIYYCPYCEHLLEYEYYNFETLGKYHCSNCDFKYDKAKIVGQDLDLEKKVIKIEDVEILIGGGMLYQAYNTVAAYTLLSELKFKNEDIKTVFNRLNDKKSLNFEVDNKKYYPISCKAENATTYNQAIFKIAQDKSIKDVIIGWKEISRRYNYFDVSWLYDIEFELLNNKNLNKIYACGIDKNNIKRRLVLAGISEDKIITSDSIKDIKNRIRNSKAKAIYGILNFDYVEPFNEVLKEDL